MDDWKQRTKTLLDQIYAVDPCYVQSNECRPTGQISYADITAGRSSPNSRGSSPFRNPRDEAASSSSLAIQVLKPSAQKPIVDRARDDSTSRVAGNEDRTKIEAAAEQKESESRTQTRHESKMDAMDGAPKHRPNSRRAAFVKKDATEPINEPVNNVPSTETVNVPETLRLTDRKVEQLTLKNTLAPREERRGRSASPIWMPGFTSYADILRGQANASPSPSVEPTKTKDSAIETSCLENEKVELGIPLVEIEESVQSNQQATESYRNRPEVSSTVKPTEEEPETEPGSWAEESIEDYELLNEKSYENLTGTQQVPEVYNYVHPPMPELVGFIGSQIAYPVSSYVYMPTAPPQPMALPCYDGQIAFPSEPYVAQSTYIREAQLYQQNETQKQSQRQQSRFKNPGNPSVAIQNVEGKRVPCQASPSVNQQPTIVQPVQPVEPEKPVESEVRESPSTPEATAARSKAQTDSKTFSYAQILSQGLNSRATSTTGSFSTTTINLPLKRTKERSRSPTNSTTSSVHETTPPQQEVEKGTRESSVTKQEVRQEETAWDTTKKRDTRKIQQEKPKSKTKEEKTKKKARKGPEQPKEKAQKEKVNLAMMEIEAKEQVSLEKITSSTKSDETEARNETKDNPRKKKQADVLQEKQTNVQQEKQIVAPQGNISQEKKRKAKKKKTEKSVDDEIEKALKEIEDMDKQKSRNQRDKSKEQAKSKDPPRSTPEKIKEETEKKNPKSNEKKKLPKSKAESKARDASPIIEETTESRASMKEQLKSKDDAKGKKENKYIDKVKEKESRIETQPIDSKKSEAKIDSIGETTLLEELDSKEKKSQKESTTKKKQKGKDQQNAAKEKSNKDAAKPTKPEICMEETKKCTSTDDATNVEVKKEQQSNADQVKIQESKSPKKDNVFEPMDKAETESKEKVDAKIMEPMIQSKEQDNAKKIVTKENAKGKSKKAKQANEQDGSKEQTSKKSSQRKNPREKTVEQSTQKEIVKLGEKSETHKATVEEVVATDHEEKQDKAPEKELSETNQGKIVGEGEPVSEIITTEGTKANVENQIEESVKEEIIVMQNEGRSKENVSVPDKLDNDKIDGKQTIERTIRDIVPTENITTPDNDGKESNLSGSEALSSPKPDTENQVVTNEKKDVIDLKKVSRKPDEETKSEISEQRNRPLGTPSKIKKPSKSKEKVVTEKIAPTYIVESKEEAKTSQPSTPKLDKKKKKKVIDSGAASPPPILTDESDVTLTERTEIVSETEFNKAETIVSKVVTVAEMVSSDVGGGDKQSLETVKSVDDNEKETLKEPLKDVPPTSTKNDCTKKKSKGSRTTESNKPESKGSVAEMSKEEEIDQEESPSTATGNAFTVEKILTTVTTTTSNPGPVEVKPSNVKSVKSVEILESIPLPKIVGSKPTELITLRPETVEASLTTRYARVSDDSAVGILPKASLDTLADSEKLNSDYAIYIDSLTDDDQPVLFGSVQDRKRGRSGAPLSPKLIEGSKGESKFDLAKEQGPDRKVPQGKSSEVNVKTIQTKQSDDIVEAKSTGTLVSKDENIIVEGNQESSTNLDKIIVSSSSTGRNFIPDEEKEVIVVEKITSDASSQPETCAKTKDVSSRYYEDLVRPYWLNYHSYIEAESDFHRRFKVVELVQENLPGSAAARSASIERIVQESVMKKPDQEKPAKEEINRSETEFRKDALIAESVKYPISTFRELESQWVKSKLAEEKKIASALLEEAETIIDQVEKRIVQMQEEEKQRTEATDKNEGTVKMTEVTGESLKIDIDKGITDIIRKDTTKNESPEKILKDETVEDLNSTDLKVAVNTENEMQTTEAPVVNDNTSKELCTTMKEKEELTIDKKEKIQEEKTQPEETRVEAKMTLEIEKEIQPVGEGKEMTMESKITTKENVAEEKPLDKTVPKNENISQVSPEEDIEKSMKEEKFNVEDVTKTGLLEPTVVNDTNMSESLVNGKVLEPTTRIPQSPPNEDKTKSKEGTKTCVKSGKQKQLAKDKQNDAKAKSITAEKEPMKQTANVSESNKKRDGKSKKGNEIVAPIPPQPVDSNEQILKTEIEGRTVTEVVPVEESKKEDSETERKDSPKEDIQPPSCGKSWAFVVGAKVTTEATTESLQNVAAIDTPRESVIETSKIEKAVQQVEKNIPEESQQKPTKRPKKKKDAKQEKSGGARLRTSPIETESKKEEAKTVVEKIQDLPEAARECNNKSYAEITATNRRTPPQTDQDDAIIKPAPLKFNQSLDKVSGDKAVVPEETTVIVKPTAVQETKEEVKIEEIPSNKAMEPTIELELSSWVEEIEREEEGIDSIINTLNNTNIETSQKAKGSWAAIVGEHVEPKESTAPIIDESIAKKEQTSELRSPAQVKIYVEESAEPVPIENVVQVDEHGFIEFVNRRELRSRRSRSRSRSARRDETYSPMETTTKQSKNKEKSKTKDTDTAQETKKGTQTPVTSTQHAEEKDKLKEIEETQQTVNRSENLEADKEKTPEQPKLETKEQSKTATKKGKKSKKVEEPAPVAVPVVAPVAKEKSKRKNKQGKKSKREEQEIPKPAVEKTVASKNEDVKTLSTDSLNTIIQELLEEAVNRGESKVMPETMLQTDKEPPQKSEVEEKETAENKKDEDVKDGTEIKEYAGLERQTGIKESVEETLVVEEEQVTETQKTEDIPKIKPAIENGAKEDKVMAEKIAVRDQEETSKALDKIEESNVSTEEVIGKKSKETVKELQPPIVKELETLIEDTAEQVSKVSKPIDLLEEEIEELPIILDSIETQLQTEEEFEKCISAEPEIETADIVIEPVKPKVQFYIADEILVLSPEKKKPVQTPLILKTLSDPILGRSKFLSLDSGFWPEKHPYHEAERYLFENLANYTKGKPSRDIKRDSNDPGDFGGDRDGSFNDRRGNDGPLNSFLMGGPHTERLIADLPGGIGSWSDYSTYLSSENEQRTDRLLSEVVEEEIATPVSGILPTGEPPSQGSSACLEDTRFESPSLPATFDQPSTLDEEITCYATCSRLPLGPDSSIGEQLEQSNSFNPRDSSSPTPPSVPRHSPGPKEHLGRERGSMQRQSPNVETERETGVAEDEAEKRIRGIKDIIQERLMVLQLSLSNLKGTRLPRDNIDTMLSALTALLTELDGYEQETRKLEEELRKIPADAEAQRLLSNLAEIQTRIATLLAQAEQGRATLEGARGHHEQRGHDIHAYKQFLDETDAWLKNIVASMREQQPIVTTKALQDELSSHAQRVSELESLPEISALAKVLKNALLEVMSRLQQRQQELCEEEAQADDMSERDDATLDQAPSIQSSFESSMPSLVDVSLQTGQSLLANDIVEKPQQLTKQTSTNQIPEPATCHSLTTQTVDNPNESPQVQETIKIVKTTDGNHDVIEIATKNLATVFDQEIEQERLDTMPEDIVVDMKYQDPKNTDNTTSELNIVHAAPQSFETVLVEPDDVITEVVVDEDGSKRIIVRKLRRTMVTSRQTTQQHLSSMTTAIGDAPSVVHAFSEATMRDQQITVTAEKPNGTIETTTKQIYGGRIATGTPFKDVDVEEYESAPRYTHTVTQGNIRDVSPQPLEDGIQTEAGEYQAKTSSVHAMVQQVTRRVVRKTRRIIRKVTIVDGKETASEEIIEEPEEVEVDEKNIPHISINVVKHEEQRQFGGDGRSTEERTQDRFLSKEMEESKTEKCLEKEQGDVDDTPMQGPFFGAFAKDMHPGLPTGYLDPKRKESLPEMEKETVIIEEVVTDAKTPKEEVSESSEEQPSESLQESLAQIGRSMTDGSVESVSVSENKKVPETVDKYESEQFAIEVNGKKSLMMDSQAFIDAEISAGLQSPIQEIKVQETQQIPVESPIDSVALDDLPTTTKATCKSVDAPVKIETPGIELEERTVDLEKHDDISGTVVPDVPVLEESWTIKAITSETQGGVPLLSEELQQKIEISGDQPDAEKTEDEPHIVPINDKQQLVKDSFVPESEYDFFDEALKPEYKPLFHKVEISLAVRKEGEEIQPMVSVTSQAEPTVAPYRMVKEDVDISLPADKESTSIIQDKIVQTSPVSIPEQQISTADKSIVTTEKEVVTSDKPVITSEREETSDKSVITSEKEEITDKSVVTSEKEDECHTDIKTEEEAGSPIKSPDTKSSTWIVSNIADSVEINVPLSGSSIHVSETPRPDVAEMIEPTEIDLTLKDETSKDEDGYRADDRTMASTATPDDENVARKKRRKKKKQRMRSSREEEQSEFPKTTTDEGEFTDDLAPTETEDAKATKKKKKKKKREDISKEETARVPALNEADTQTTPREFNVTVAATLSPQRETICETFVQTSPQPSEWTKMFQAQEIQTSMEILPEDSEEIEIPKAEQVHANVQTSPLTALDFGAQTIPEETSPPVTRHSEIQTSPVSVFDFGIQTATETPRIEEISTQTLNTSEMRVEEVQTSPMEHVQPTIVSARTEETQASPNVVSIEAQTSPWSAPSLEIETQTIEKTLVATEQQTTTPPATEQKDLTGIGVQTVTPEESKTIETEAQTSVSTSPEKITLDLSVVETQTTPEKSPRRTETQETESQTVLPEPTQETVTQTSPTTSVSPIRVQVRELSAQTSLEDVKQQTIDEQSQTSSPEKIKMSDSSVQIKATELIPRVEESVQIVPDTVDRKLSLLTVSQQTNGGVLQPIDTVADHAKEQEETIMTDDAEEDVLPAATVDVLDAAIEMKTPLKDKKITAAPDVQVQEIQDESKMEKVKSMEPKSETKESKDASADTSFEICLQATIELSTSDSITDTGSILTDMSSDTAIIQGSSNTAKAEDSNAAKRQKQKRRRKTIEICSPGEKNLESIFGQPIESRDISLKLSYSDVAQKNAGKKKSPVSEVIGLEKVSEQADDVGQKEYSKFLPEEMVVEIKECIEDTSLPFTTTTGPTIVQDTQDEWNLDKEMIEAPLETEVVASMPSLEPMDTAEEQLKEQASWEMPHQSISQKADSSKGFILPATMNDDCPPPLQMTLFSQATKIISDRMQNLRNVTQPSHLGNILHVVHLDSMKIKTTEEPYFSNIQKDLSILRKAIQEKDMFVIEDTLECIVVTITAFLETIEYRIFWNNSSYPIIFPCVAEYYSVLEDEANNMEKYMQKLNNIWKLVKSEYPEEDRNNVQECLDALTHQAKMIHDLTSDSVQHITTELARWEKFENGVKYMYRCIEGRRADLNVLIKLETSTKSKLQELDELENINRCNMLEIESLIAESHELQRDHPGKDIPKETYTAHEMTKAIEHDISIERDRLLQLLALAEEYEQTLREFAQITEIAENLLGSPISVISLEHLQEEMQKHRKFFVNLNHCRGILESLEGNLDPETRTKYSDLHEELHSRAMSLLDQAASRAQQMALAASRWIILEQGVKEERGWLQVAHQRVPDLETVTSSDYDQYISLHQTLVADVTTHHARLVQLLNVARSLQDLINIEDPEDRYGEALDVIVKLQENVESSLRRLLGFKESWCNQEVLTNRLENWMAKVERELENVRDPSGGHIRQFWELKAQYEVHNNMREEANNSFEQALRIVPLSDEMLQRQFHRELQDRWNDLAQRINSIQEDVTRNISSEEISSNEKLKLLERELNQLRMTIDGFHGVLKTEEELDLYIERLTVLFDRISLIQNELGRLGLLPVTESEKVAFLLSLARRVESQINGELDAAQLIRERLQAIQRGFSRVRKAHKRQSSILDQCEGSERQGSDVVTAAVDRCQTVLDELATLWQDIMGLRQMLHTLPIVMRVSVSPVSVERDISILQDAHADLEARCHRLLGLLKNRLTLWRRFEKQLEMVQQSVQEADYMMELLTVQGSVDYDRLLKATERLEGLNGDLGAREVLIGELREAAEPLREGCAAEVREKVEAAVNEAVQAWEDTRAELDALCTKYQHACRLWEQYKDSSAAVKAWADTQMDSVANLPPEEAVKHIKICEETMAEHKERLAELRGLVAQIASDVGLDASEPLHCEVEALGQRLEDIRETLSCLADAADARALNQEVTRGDLCHTKNFLDSVRQSLTVASSCESNEQLKLLRNHLLALTRTKPQLKPIKERISLEASTQEPSVVEVLRLWQRVFTKTFDQYHRLSARLVETQDGATALKLWQEYLSHVQDFLSNGVPGDYNGLSEHRNLCEVHRNLLTVQRDSILKVRTKEGSTLSTTEQFNILTNLHNETLAKIMERHAAVHDRLAGWDRYKHDQSKLLAWLKKVERERSQLRLRFIHLRRLEEILQRIETLLETIPQGETQLELLEKQQESLLVDCDEALAVSIRMEHAADAQRIANLRASLETWRDFVQRIQKLHADYEKQTKRIGETFDEIGQAVSTAFHSKPLSLSRTNQLLESVRQLQVRLSGMSSDLESVDVIAEQLRECLSPSDMKTLNQQRMLFYQQHGNLEHSAALLVYRLMEDCCLYDRWKDKLARLLSWIEEMEMRIQNCDTTAPNEPEEALKRLECELQAEIVLKQRELSWLQNTGQDLIQVAEEEEEKERLQRSLDEANERWDRLLTTGKARATKLVDLMRTMSTLERRINELRIWLASVESQLSETLVIETISQSCIDKKLEDHEHLQKAIEAESGNVGEVLNACEILLSDCDAWKASFNTDAIKIGMEGLESRWTATCKKSAERKGKIALAWKILQELQEIKSKHEGWIDETDKALLEFESNLDEISKDESNKAIERAKMISRGMETRESVVKVIEENFARLARTGLEPDNLKSLISEIRQLIDKWRTLKPRIGAVLLALQQGQKNYRDFITVHGAAVVGLTQVDVRLTRIQHLAMPEQKASIRRRLQQLNEIDDELKTQNITLRKADDLALKVMQECHPDEVATIQELVDEYQLLWRDIQNRVISLRAEIDGQDKVEVDEAVQVETLKFEQDSAVQVDTLPKLLRMTSSDAYLMELEAALVECSEALDTLEIAVTPYPAAGPGLNATARNISNLIGSCQSSIELVRHLHGLLVEDGKLSTQAAKGSEVAALTERYDNLLLLARTREQQIRELSDHGRLTCPLCARRNWAQLENDVWRLEKWLEFAEGTQSEQQSPPSNIEQLEDVIQYHREFLLDLDSHKSILASLNTVGAHLADHTEDTRRATQLRDRLTIANERWDKVCTLAAHWQEQLQTALNHQSHRIIEELFAWLEKTEISIKSSEPVDLTESSEIMTIKYNKFRELRSDLERCEPQVLSLQESANQLLDEKGETRACLQELRLRLQSLRRLTGIYALKLGAALGMDPRDVGLAATTTSLASLSHDLLDEAASGTIQPHDTPDTDGDDDHGTMLSRGYRFLGRVLRVSLPIQALILVVLGAASLVPSAEEDYSCMLSNNLARSFTPMVVYPNGPPPI